MHMALKLGYSGGASAESWAPADLGADLLAFWDAEEASSLTLDTAAVTTWTDTIGGYAPTQDTAANKPAYSATSFNGRPGISFDGANDFLNLESVALPTGADPSEVWILMSQDALPADTAARGLFAYGGTASTNRRIVSRIVVTGANVMQANVGTAGGGVTADAVGDFSGIHIVRATWSATHETASLDGVAGTPTAAVPTTATTRIRIGAHTSNTPTSFAHGIFNKIIVTVPLTGASETQMIAYLKAIGGIA